MSGKLDWLAKILERLTNEKLSTARHDIFAGSNVFAFISKT